MNNLDYIGVGVGCIGISIILSSASCTLCSVTFGAIDGASVAGTAMGISLLTSSFLTGSATSAVGLLYGALPLKDLFVFSVAFGILSHAIGRSIDKHQRSSATSRAHID